MIETGTTVLLLTTLPRAALAVDPVDDNEPSPPLVELEFRSMAILIR